MMKRQFQLGPSRGHLLEHMLEYINDYNEVIMYIQSDQYICLSFPAFLINIELFLLLMREQPERQLDKIAIRILTRPTIRQYRKWDQ